MQDTLRRLLASTALLGALALPATAQDVIDLDEITFSANLVPIELGRSGSSVSVITRNDIEASGGVQVSDLLARLPGVSVVQSGPIGTTTDVRIRGAHPRYTQVLIDGIRVNDPSSASATFSFGTLTTGDVERIEVLRGSQSARFGSGAVGGVVNITTHGADAEGTSQSAFVEAGSFNTLNARYRLSTAGTRGDISFNLTRFQTRGFSAFDEADGGRERDGFRATRASLSARHFATDDLTVGMTLFAQRSRSEYDGFLADAENVERRDQYGLRGFAEYRLGESTHVFDVTHFRTDREDDFENFLGLQQVDDFRGNRLGASYVGTTPLGGSLLLSYGLDAEQERVRIRRNAGATTEVEVDESRWGTFAETLYTPLEGLDITANLRHEQHSVFGGRSTGRLAFAWQAVPELTLRGAMATGYRVPDIPQRFGAFGNEDLQPEKSRSAEIGMDYQFAAGLRASGTLFWLATTDEITFGPAPTFTPLNIEATRRRGVELELSAPVGPATDLSAAYTYTEAEITEGPQAGLRLGRVPRHDLSVTARTRLADRWRAQANFQAVTDRLDRNGAMPLPGYGVVNASITYELTPSADVTFRIDNVFDKQYQKVAGYATSNRAVYLGIASRF